MPLEFKKRSNTDTRKMREMSNNWLTRDLRFILELFALAVMTIWGWYQGTGLFRYLLAAGIPLAAAGLWGIFTVPDDPSRGGQALVPIPGLLRLLLELLCLGTAVVMLWSLDAQVSAVLFLGLILVHYFAAGDRVNWLLDH